MSAIKTIGTSGQIALGEQYAGQHVLVDEPEPGVWVIKVGRFIPDNEQWLHDPEVSSSLDRALRWTAANPPVETNLDDLELRLDELG